MKTLTTYCAQVLCAVADALTQCRTVKRLYPEDILVHDWRYLTEVKASPDDGPRDTYSLYDDPVSGDVWLVDDGFPAVCVDITDVPLQYENEVLP